MGEREPEFLYHLVLPDAWRAHEQTGASDWQPDSLAREGFVHLSYAHQLERTLRLHFAAADEVLLLELDPERLPVPPALEPTRDGECFPHLYAALPLTAVLRVHVLRRGEQGFTLPGRIATPPAGMHRRPPPPEWPRASKGAGP